MNWTGGGGGQGEDGGPQGSKPSMQPPAEGCCNGEWLLLHDTAPNIWPADPRGLWNKTITVQPHWTLPDYERAPIFRQRYFIHRWDCQTHRRMAFECSVLNTIFWSGREVTWETSWRFKSSGMLRSVNWWTATDVSEGRRALTFRVDPRTLFDPEDKDITRHGVTTPWIFINTAVITSNVAGAS